MYHGTKENFDKFDSDKIGTASDYGFYGKGFYFSPERQTASGYGHIVKESHVSFKKPLIYDDESSDYFKIKGKYFDKGGNDKDYAERVREGLEKDGYDGVVLKHAGKITQVVAFNPEQIEDVKGNSETRGSQDSDSQSTTQGSGEATIPEKKNFDVPKLENMKLWQDYIGGRIYPDKYISQLSEKDKKTIADYVEKNLPETVTLYVGTSEGREGNNLIGGSLSESVGRHFATGNDWKVYTYEVPRDAIKAFGDIGEKELIFDKSKAKEISKVEPYKKSSIPEFKSTQDAIAFGDKATPEQAEELKRLREETVSAGKKLMAEKKMQEALNTGVKAQFYREALEAYEKDPNSSVSTFKKNEMKSHDTLAASVKSEPASSHSEAGSTPKDQTSTPEFKKWIESGNHKEKAEDHNGTN